MNEEKQKLTLVVVGPKHAGKTVYLTALANCSGISLSDPASIEIIKLHWKTLREGKTPPATAGTISDLQFTFQGSSENGEAYNIDFSIPDYDGHFAETLSKHAESGDIGKLRQNIADADGFIVFMPVGDDDVQTMEELRHEIGSFIGIVREVYDSSAKIPLPLIVAVNKWDKAQAFQSPQEDAEAENYINSTEIYSLLFERLKSFFDSVTVLAISAYGHRTDDANPLPGAIAPYRVTEPVMIVVKEFFSNLRKMVESQESQKDFFNLANTLLGTEPLWKRWPSCDYATLLEQALNACFDSLRSELIQATDLRQFEQIWQKCPQSSLTQHFSPEQQLELERIKAPLAQAALIRKKKISGALVAGIFLCTIIGYSVYFVQKCSKDYVSAMDAEVQNQYSALSNFLNQYGSSNWANIFMGSHIADARNKMHLLVEKVQNGINDGLDKLQEIPDSCARASEAKQLRQTANDMGLSIAQESVTRLETILKNSEEICMAKGQIETAARSDQIEEAKKLLADKNSTEEVTNLKSLAADREAQLEQQERERAEQARVSAIAEKYADLVRAKNIVGAREFVLEYSQDPSHVVKDLVAKTQELMPQLVFSEAMEILKRMRNLDENNLSELRDFFRDNLRTVELSDQQINAIRARLQDLGTRTDQERIKDIPEKITSLQQLNAAIDSYKVYSDVSMFKIDGGIFVYRRPQNLDAELKEKATRIRSYIDALDNGISASWLISAQPNNVIDLDCQNLIARDARLEISFDGILPNKYPNNIQCRRIDGNRGYDFFTDGTVKPYESRIELIKQTLIGNPKICSSRINLTPDDLINIFNGGEVQMDLSSNCRGISFRIRR